MHVLKAIHVGHLS